MVNITSMQCTEYISDIYIYKIRVKQRHRMREIVVKTNGCDRELKKVLKKALKKGKSHKKVLKKVNSLKKVLKKARELGQLGAV